MGRAGRKASRRLSSILLPGSAKDDYGKKKASATSGTGRGRKTTVEMTEECGCGADSQRQTRDALFPSTLEVAS